MDQVLLELVYGLIDEIKESNEYKKYELSKKNVEDNLFLQIASFNNAKDEYYSLQKLSEYNVDSKNALNNLIDKKKKLFSNSLMIEYIDAKNILNSYLDEILNRIKESISKSIKIKEKIKMVKGDIND